MQSIDRKKADAAMQKPKTVTGRRNQALKPAAKHVLIAEGLGKTHLLLTIDDESKQKYPAPFSGASFIEDAGSNSNLLRGDVERDVVMSSSTADEDQILDVNISPRRIDSESKENNSLVSPENMANKESGGHVSEPQGFLDRLEEIERYSEFVRGQIDLYMPNHKSMGRKRLLSRNVDDAYATGRLVEVQKVVQVAEKKSNLELPSLTEEEKSLLLLREFQEAWRRIEAIIEYGDRSVNITDIEGTLKALKNIPALPQVTDSNLPKYDFSKRGNDPISFCRNNFRVWIDAGLMDVVYLNILYPGIDAKIDTRCTANKKKRIRLQEKQPESDIEPGYCGPEARTEVFPDATMAADLRLLFTENQADLVRVEERQANRVARRLERSRQ